MFLKLHKSGISPETRETHKEDKVKKNAENKPEYKDYTSI